MNISDRTSVRRQRWRPSRRQPDEHERAFAAWLRSQAVKYGREDVLLVGGQAAAAPDFHIYETAEWAEQFVEYTHGHNSDMLRRKVKKLRAVAQAHGVRVTLVIGGDTNRCPGGVEILYFREFQDDPQKFLRHLRQLAPAAQAA